LHLRHFSVLKLETRTRISDITVRYFDAPDDVDIILANLDDLWILRPFERKTWYFLSFPTGRPNTLNALTHSRRNYTTYFYFLPLETFTEVKYINILLVIKNYDASCTKRRFIDQNSASFDQELSKASVESAVDLLH
jgi:hypothetical protein